MADSCGAMNCVQTVSVLGGSLSFFAQKRHSALYGRGDCRGLLWTERLRYARRMARFSALYRAGFAHGQMS